MGINELKSWIAYNEEIASKYKFEALVVENILTILGMDDDVLYDIIMEMRELKKMGVLNDEDDVKEELKEKLEERGIKCII